MTVGKLYWAVKPVDFQTGKYYESVYDLKKENPQIGFLSHVFVATCFKEENGKKYFNDGMCVAVA